MFAGARESVSELMGASLLLLCAVNEFVGESLLDSLFEGLSFFRVGEKLKGISKGSALTHIFDDGICYIEYHVTLLGLKK